MVYLNEQRLASYIITVTDIWVGIFQAIFPGTPCIQHLAPKANYQIFHHRGDLILCIIIKNMILLG